MTEETFTLLLFDGRTCYVSAETPDQALKRAHFGMGVPIQCIRQCSGSRWIVWPNGRR